MSQSNDDFRQRSEIGEGGEKSGEEWQIGLQASQVVVGRWMSQEKAASWSNDVVRPRTSWKRLAKQYAARTNLSLKLERLNHHGVIASLKDKTRPRRFLTFTSCFAQNVSFKFLPSR